MENKINIAELLKNCPTGMELDCTLYEDVYFDYVDELNIIHCYIQNEGFKTIKTSITFNQYGAPNSYIKSKCVIFPKSKNTWDGFVPCKFKDGDIITDKHGNIAIYKKVHKYFEDPHIDFYCGLVPQNKLFVIKNDKYQNWGKIEYIKFATEKEKEKLFQVIKDNGYRWNTETKTLEKLPKFKVGDRIVERNPISNSWIVASVSSEYYGLKLPNDSESIGVLPVSDQDNWELVPNKFDINTLKPFDKVLVRDGNDEAWVNAFFGFCDPVTYKKCIFVTGNENWCQCIPYEGNEHLLGKTDDCDEYFKNW